jgi:NADH-quinone oxidoreductase subunit N
MTVLGGSAAPLVVLGGGAVLVLLLDLLWEGRASLLRAASTVLLALGAVAAWGVPAAGPAFGGAVQGDALARVADLLAVGGAASAVWLPPPGEWGRRWGAYLALVLWSAAGMALAAAAGNLIALFLGIEVLSLALYALAAFPLEDGRAAEAGFKYFVLGGLGSGLLLFGAALLYAGTGSLGLTSAGGSGGLLGTVGLGLVVAGLGFKLALAPLQMWVPDVYQGAPTPVTAFMAVGTKAAAFAALARVVTSAFGVGGSWVALVVGLGVLSMFAGYLLALGQPGMKRLLAYSGVANAGTLVLALLAPDAWRPVAFVYLAAYAAAAIGAFAVVSAVDGAEAGDDMAALRGLGRSHPWLAAAFLTCLLSLASVPPTGGFLGKLLLLESLARAGYGALAVLVVAATVVALYPYLKLAVAVLAAPAEGEAVPALRASRAPAVLAGLAMLATFAIGILPGPLLGG